MQGDTVAVKTGSQVLASSAPLPKLAKVSRRTFACTSGLEMQFAPELYLLIYTKGVVPLLRHHTRYTAFPLSSELHTPEASPPFDVPTARLTEPVTESGGSLPMKAAVLAAAGPPLHRV